MGCFPSNFFYITLIASYNDQGTLCDYFSFFCGIFDSYDPTKELRVINVKTITNNRRLYKINREFCYLYKFKEQLINKFELIKKNYKEIRPNENITIIFDKDVDIKVQVIERYWRRYRWNYRRNLAAIKYHPSKIDFTFSLF